MAIGGQIHCHALGAHTLAAHNTVISCFRPIFIPEWPLEKCDLLGTCGNLTVLRYRKWSFKSPWGYLGRWSINIFLGEHLVIGSVVMVDRSHLGGWWIV